VPHPASRPGRARRRTLLGVAFLAMASAAFAVRRPLLMSAPACFAGRWHGCFDTFNGVVLMTVVALPMATLVVWALARRRQAAGVPSAWPLSAAEVGMVYGTLPFVWLVLMPGSGAGIVPGRLSLVPLQDLPTMGPLGIVGNLLVLAALGFFAPMRFAALASVPRVAALAALLGPDRNRAIRPAAGPGVLRRRRTAQHRRRRRRRTGVAPLVACRAEIAVGPVAPHAAVDGLIVPSHRPRVSPAIRPRSPRRSPAPRDRSAAGNGPRSSPRA
jgi:hypothetical protein